MGNTYKLVWTDEALSNLENIISYLEEYWTIRELTRFSRLLENQLQLIQTIPELFPVSPTSNSLRKSVLSKQTTIYYKVQQGEIQIVSLFDTRQNPSKLDSQV